MSSYYPLLHETLTAIHIKQLRLQIKFSFCPEPWQTLTAEAKQYWWPINGNTNSFRNKPTCIDQLSGMPQTYVHTPTSLS